MQRDPSPDASLVDDGRSQMQRLKDGDWYIADEPEIFEIMQRQHQIALDFEEAFTKDPVAAQGMLEQLFGSVGEGTSVRPPIKVDFGLHTHIGERVAFNFDCVILDVAEVHIGDDCLFGPRVQLLTPTHPIAAEPRRAKIESADPIVLGKNVWVGGGAIILGGVTIGDNCVIGAGAVVTKDVPANSVAVGNPARVVKRVD